MDPSPLPSSRPHSVSSDALHSFRRAQRSTEKRRMVILRERPPLDVGELSTTNLPRCSAMRGLFNKGRELR